MIKAVVVGSADRWIDQSVRESVVRSFDEFFVAEYPKMVRLAWAFTGRRDIAEEEAQESLMAAYRNWAKVSRYHDPSAWLRRVVANRCTSIGRRRLTEARLIVRLRAARLRNLTYH